MGASTKPGAIQLKRIETGQNSCILELEELPADPGDSAAAAMRGRIRARFAQLHGDREQIETQLAALAKTTPKAATRPCSMSSRCPATSCPA